MALALAILSSLCFGIALVTGRVGLRTLDARSGAAISIPTATLLFITAAPFAFDLLQFDVRAVLLFAIVGLFFPAVVTLLTFRSNEILGPTTTGVISSTAPLFALIGAALLLGERVPFSFERSPGIAVYTHRLELYPIRHPLMVKPGSVNRLLNIHPKIDDVDDHLEDRVDDRWAARASDREPYLAILQHDCGRHCRQRALARGDRIVLALKQAIRVWHAGLRCKIVHLIIQQNTCPACRSPAPHG